MALYRTWSRHGWVRWVALTDRPTGTRGVGRHWRSWEEAHSRAFDDLVRKLIRRLDEEASELDRDA